MITDKKKKKKKAKYFIPRCLFTEQIRFRPDIQQGDTLKLNASILETREAPGESDSETHYPQLKPPRC